VHAERGDWAAAVEANESAFRRDVSYENYQQLVELAGRAGDARKVRDSVVAFLQSPVQRSFWRDERYALTLAQIFRAEQDWLALKAIAVERMQDPDRLLQVARWLSKPELALAQPIFEKAVDAFILRKTNFSYQVAVRTLMEARPAFQAVSATAFDDYLARLMETHKRKRNFMALLTQETLAGAKAG
jgi:hypothetical protein